MEKVTLESIHEEIQELARITAAGFASTDEKFATKEELSAVRKELKTDMQAGFSLIMENLLPMRRDYQALKDDVVPQLVDHDTRITKLEHHISR